MTKALKWVRKSKGSEDDIGLVEQRDRVGETGEALADGTEWLDLGIQSGFSTLTRDADAPTTWLDQNEDVQAAVERLRDGEYDYLVAYDDRRICRDDYLSVIQYAANQGNCEIVYVGDVAEDSLAYDIHRRVERETKEEEIEKSKAAIERRKREGYDHGRPKFGMTYDDEGKYQVPGENFDTVLEILRHRRLGKSYREIAAELDVAVATARRVVGRREWYIDRSKHDEIVGKSEN